MNNPIAYSKHNNRQRRDNLLCLKENIAKMNWKSGAKVIDIGCGDGGFTAGALRKILPDDIEELRGIDKSPEMVDHANVNYGDELINFTVLDITKELANEFIGHYDHAFSFYTLHWVFDQKKAFSNIYDLLADDGDCLLLILGDIAAFFDVNKIFASSEKWGKWVKDLENVISPYHGCLEPEGRVRQLLTAAGFQHVEVECKKYGYTYDNMDDFKKSVKAVTAFKIPVDMYAEYLDDYVETALNQGFIGQDLKIEYYLITVYCKKNM